MADRMVMCKVLVREKRHGFRLEPGQIIPFPEWLVDDLIQERIIENVDLPRITNVDWKGSLHNVPPGARVFVKLPEKE